MTHDWLFVTAANVWRPKSRAQRIEGVLIIRMAMSMDVFTRPHQQIQQVLVSVRDVRQPKLKI